jgi:hypothetical protein
MKKLLFLTPLLFLLFVSYTYAESEVNVKVSNDVNSSSTSQSENTTKTNIRIQTDDKVMEYESEKPGSVNIKSVNGETEIEEDGVKITPNPTKNLNKQPSITESPKPTSIKEQIEEKSNQLEKMMESIKEKFIYLQEKLFSFFD